MSLLGSKIESRVFMINVPEDADSLLDRLSSKDLIQGIKVRFWRKS